MTSLKRPLLPIESQDESDTESLARSVSTCSSQETVVSGEYIQNKYKQMVFVLPLVSKASDHKYRYLKNFMEWVERTIFYPIKSFDVRVVVEIEGSVEAFDTEVRCVLSHVHLPEPTPLLSCSVPHSSTTHCYAKEHSARNNNRVWKHYQSLELKSAHQMVL